MIDYTVYLGPYLQCEYATEGVVQCFVACPNEGCLQRGFRTAADFCPMCGTQTESFSETSHQANVNRFELVDEIDEALFPISLEYIELDAPVHIWVPNVARDAPREFSLNPCTDYQIMPIFEHHRIAEQSWFIRAFSEEVAILGQHYKGCLVYWGIIVCSS